jgi:hypothetical protein
MAHYIQSNANLFSIVFVRKLVHLDDKSNFVIYHIYRKIRQDDEIHFDAQIHIKYSS